MSTTLKEVVPKLLMIHKVNMVGRKVFNYLLEDFMGGINQLLGNENDFWGRI